MRITLGKETEKIVVLKEHDGNDENLEKSEFGFYLKNIRTYLGMGRGEFSRLLGVNQRTYYNYEVGESFPDDWLYIKQKVGHILKNKRLGRDLSYNIEGGNESLISEIVSLHKEGKNIVQIGIKCGIDERTVSSILIDKGYNPITFSFYD